MADAFTVDDYSLDTLTPSTAAQALELCIQCGQPVLLRGEAGIGKSSIWAQVAHKLEMEFIDLRGSQLDAVDIRGVPAIEGGQTVWKTPSFLPTGGKGLICIDEINRATTSVQNSLFQLILDRRIGDYVLPSGWVVGAAINPEGSMSAVGTTKMSQAMNNRWVHINIRVDVDDWCKWAMGNGILPVVVAFIRFRPDLLHQPSRTDYAFPTPRSWEFVSKMISLNPTGEVELALLAGAVGQGAAVEFAAFIRTWRKLPSIDGILLDPAGANVPEDVATMYAVASALAHRANEANLGRVIQYLERLPSEYNVFAVRDAVSRDSTLATTPEFTAWAVKHSEEM